MPTDMTIAPALRPFIGKGEFPGRSWWRTEGDEITYVPPTVPPAAPRILPLGHPAAYEASDELVAAVETALLLRKPLLVTGKPGTGKTELAERIAYEFNLGPVLRFEAQSLSEANDLFYRFDHIGQLIAAKLVEGHRGRPEDADVMNFVQYGPLGKAILRSMPGLEGMLLDEARKMTASRFVGLAAQEGGKALVDASVVALRADAKTHADADADEPSHKPVPRPAQRSVVLIDEIDKASRDFPNDLLNGIDRMDFRLRELGSRAVRGAGRDSDFHPIVVVTSNSERDLPHPFMRRCVFAHIGDPDSTQMAAIVRKRVFGDGAVPPVGSDGLPPLYSRLLGAFIELRNGNELRYPIGTSEFLDLALVARRQGITGFDASPAVIELLRRAVGAIAKHPTDRELVLARFAALTS